MDKFVQDYEVFDLGEFGLQTRQRDPRRQARVQDVRASSTPTRATRSSTRSWYSGFHWDNEWLIGEGMGLDPAKYFIIVPNMLGNGLSSSPSNTPPPFDRARFPRVTFYDQVEAAAQARDLDSGSRRCRS